jgi:hypothetical protein
MNAYWMLPMAVCVEAKTPAEAKKKLEEAGWEEKATDAKPLPYPADPRVGEQSQCPSFCWQPNSCAGKSSCPRNVSCSE